MPGVIGGAMDTGRSGLAGVVYLCLLGRARTMTLVGGVASRCLGCVVVCVYLAAYR